MNTIELNFEGVNYSFNENGIQFCLFIRSILFAVICSVTSTLRLSDPGSFIRIVLFLCIKNAINVILIQVNIKFPYQMNCKIYRIKYFRFLLYKRQFSLVEPIGDCTYLPYKFLISGRLLCKNFKFVPSNLQRYCTPS